MATPRLGSTTTRDGWTYKFTPEDWLWAIRMLVGEAGERDWDKRWKQMEGEAILWTMLNRLYLLRNTTFSMRGCGQSGPSFPPGSHTYTKLLLAYSQPIAVMWRTCGTDTERQRRAFFAVMRPEQVPPEVVTLVTRFMQGKIPGDLYAGLVHFIAPGVEPAEEAIGPVEIPGMQARSNIFFKVAPTLRWPSPSEFFKFRFSTTAAIAAAGITLLGIGAGIGYYFWLKSQQASTAGLEDMKFRRRNRSGTLSSQLLRNCHKD